MKATLAQWHTKPGFEILFKEHYSALCAYAYGFVADYSQSEDIVQEVFAKLWAGKRKIDMDTSPKAYLYKAVGNVALNHIKHKKVEKKYEKENIAYGDYTEKGLDELLINKELSIKIQSAIERLPEGRRNVFLMSRMDGLKYKEIAEKLNVSVKTVENQMGKALSSLRKDLSGESPLVLMILCFLYRN